MRMILVTAMALVSCGAVEAGPLRGRRHVAPVASASAAPQAPADLSAQGRADEQARLGWCGHFGGQFGTPGAAAEGCGFSSVSADDAIRHCCFYGQRPLLAVGVARGANGWYACCHYR